MAKRTADLLPRPDREAIDEIVRQIVDLVDPLRIILFGSAARDEAEAGSDVDLLVVMPDGTPQRETMQRLYRSVRGQGIPFDILVTTPSQLEKHKDNKGLIYPVILEEGQQIYMAPNPSPHPGSPEDWLRYARSDLAASRVRPSGEILTETLCFHTQQAAEKAIKAVLVAHRIQVPRTHNIDALLERLPDGIEVPENVQTATDLTPYAVLSRYPADVTPVDEDEYDRAVRLAETVVAWAEQQIG